MSIVYDGLPSVVEIGYKAEQYSRNVTFDLTAMLEAMPGGTPQLVYRRPRSKTSYIAQTAMDGATMTWTVTAQDTLEPGSGQCQVMITDGEDPTAILLSQIIPVRVFSSIVDGGEDAPETYDPWISRMERTIQQLTAKKLTLTLPADGWEAVRENDIAEGGGATSQIVAWTQTVVARGVTASSAVISAPAPADIQMYLAAGVQCTAQGSGTLTFTRNVEPYIVSDFTVNVFSL